MRRTGDQYLSLDDIVKMANNSNADIFISIHNNASISPAANGTETYWCPNGVNGSSQLANLVQTNLVDKAGRSNRGVKTADFRVIKNTNMPAALVECAFVSNSEEAELLKSDSFQEKCATGLFEAIKKFSEGINKEAGFYVDNSGSSSAGFAMYIDYPRNDSVYDTNFKVWGWAADPDNKVSTGVSRIELYDGSQRNQSTYLGKASTFERVQLAKEWGNDALKNSGFVLSVDINKLSKGEHNIYVYAFDKDNNYSYVSVKVNIIKPDSEEDGSGEGSGSEESGGESQQSENAIPVASAGGPYEGNIEQEINFDGSTSTDSDGSITEYIWDFGDSTTGSGVDPTHFYTEAGQYTVTLTVKDNSGASSAPKTTTVTVTDEAKTYPVNTTPISNSTSVIGYTEVTVDQLVKLFVNRNSNKVERARRLAPLYIKYGKLFNIRADIAWAMMCHET